MSDFDALHAKHGPQRCAVDEDHDRAVEAFRRQMVRGKERTTRLQRSLHGKLPAFPPVGIDPVGWDLLAEHVIIGKGYAQIAAAHGRSADWAADRCVAAAWWLYDHKHIDVRPNVERAKDD